jgi:hypothetical protein
MFSKLTSDRARIEIAPQEALVPAERPLSGWLTFELRLARLRARLAQRQVRQIGPPPAPAPRQCRRGHPLYHDGSQWRCSTCAADYHRRRRTAATVGDDEQTA